MYVFVNDGMISNAHIEVFYMGINGNNGNIAHSGATTLYWQ